MFLPTVGLQVLELVDADELKQLPDTLAKLSDLTELTIRSAQVKVTIDNTQYTTALMISLMVPH